MKTQLYLFLVLFFSLNAIGAKQIKVDPTFAQGGEFYANISTAGAYPSVTIAQLKGGKALYARALHWQGDATYIVRMDNNGAPEDTFGDEGELVIDNQIPVELKEIPDGKILLATAYATNNVINNVVQYGQRVYQFTADGIADTTFGNNGVLELSLNNATSGRFLTFDDKTFFISGSHAYQFNRQGILDSTFATNGHLITDFEQSDAVRDTKGNFYILGMKSTNPGIFINKYNNLGMLNTAFGQNGQLFIDVPSSSSSISLASKGKLLIQGNTTSNGKLNSVVARVTENGKLDSTFATNGISTVSFVPQANDEMYATVETAGGHLLSIGSVFIGLNQNGTLDKTFENNGKLRVLKGTNVTKARLVGNKLYFLYRTVLDETDIGVFMRYLVNY